MNRYLRTFIIALVAVWIIGTVAEIYLLPTYIYNGLYKLALQKNGFSPSGMLVNTLYTQPTLGSPSSNSFLINTGANRDTLYTGGELNLSGGPEILYVPNISGRYYSIELVDSRGNDFAVIGSATTYQAGNYLITGPGWSGSVPANVTQISSPSDKALLIARVLVKNDSDLPVVYNISKQIRLTPLT